MLQKLKLKNFQSLKDVTLNLGRVTVIRGASDVGKSAVIRGLNSFFNNSFNSEYAHNGELPFGVAIQKDNKVAFGRRTAKGVEYKFDSTVYSKTAKKIPSDISDFLGIYPYAIDIDMSVFFQIQKQFDTPFLLTDSSITVAKIIGRVSNLNIVLMAMREMYASQLEAKQEVNYLYSRKKEVKNSLLRFSNFDAYESLFKRAESLEDELDLLESKKERLQEIIFMAENFNKRTAAFKQMSKEVVKLNSLLESLMLAETLRQTCSNYTATVESYRSLDSEKLDLTDSMLRELICVISKENILSEIASSLSVVSSKLETSLQKDFSVLDGIDVSLLEKIIELVSQGEEFNRKVKLHKASTSELELIEDEYNNLYNSFMEGKVICPFSKLEMQDFCKKNIQQ